MLLTFILKKISNSKLFLLNKGADTTLKNKNSATPLHQCILSKQPRMLSLILKDHPDIDVNIGGENGGAPLHYCAFNDDIESAQILLNHKAKFCQPCCNGFYPIHIAAQNSSNKVLELLFEHGSKLGCTRLNMISYVDGDNNKP